jgi:hypothetical protein
MVVLLITGEAPPTYIVVKELSANTELGDYGLLPNILGYKHCRSLLHIARVILTSRLNSSYSIALLYSGPSLL